MESFDEMVLECLELCERERVFFFGIRDWTIVGTILIECYTFPTKMRSGMKGGVVERGYRSSGGL